MSYASVRDRDGLHWLLATKWQPAPHHYTAVGGSEPRRKAHLGGDAGSDGSQPEGDAHLRNRRSQVRILSGALLIPLCDEWLASFLAGRLRRSTGRRFQSSSTLGSDSHRRVCQASCTPHGLTKHGGGKADRMFDRSDEHPDSSARGEVAWKQAREAVAERNRLAQKAGRERREAYDRQRVDARRAAEGRRREQLRDGHRTS
jgi:hypothetical protein